MKFKSQNLFITGVALLLIGCAGTIKTNSPKISTTPITYNINESANAVGVAATSIAAETQIIETSANKIVSTATTQPATPIFSLIIGSAKNILASNSRINILDAKLIAEEKQLQGLATQMTTIQGQIDEQKVALDDAIDAKIKADKALKVETDKYDSQWLAGKSWHFIYWVAGVVTGLLLLDTLLWFLTKSATLNPLTLVVFAFSGLWKLISGLWKPKSILGGL